jgi:hypothetical protein
LILKVQLFNRKMNRRGRGGRRGEEVNLKSENSDINSLVHFIVTDTLVQNYASSMQDF